MKFLKCLFENCLAFIIVVIATPLIMGIILIPFALAFHYSGWFMLIYLLVIPMIITLCELD